MSDAYQAVLDKYRQQPIDFYRDTWGTPIWRGQYNLFTQAFQHNYLSVKAGHSVGKSHMLARIALTFLSLYHPAKVITTAPTWSQVENILWSEIRAAHRKARRPLGGDLFSTHLNMTDEKFAMGISTKEADRFQGFHSPNLLLIFDEASGIPKPIWEAGDSLMSSGNCHWLAVGNPIDPTGEFYRTFRAGSGWQNMTISCLDSPNVVHQKDIIPGIVTHSWVEKKRQQWGEDSPQWAGRVIGQFPRIAVKRVILEEWIQACVSKPMDWPTSQRFITCDPADYGDDMTVAYGWKVRKPIKQMIYGKVGPMETAANLCTMADAIDAQAIIIDGIGDGLSIGERCRQLLDDKITVYTPKGSEKSSHEEYGNLRAEMWLEAAQFIREGDCQIPHDELLIEDLKEPDYHFRVGKQWIEDKEEVKKRLGRSPDRGDAYTMGLWWSGQAPALALQQEVRLPDYQHPVILDTEQSDVLMEVE